MSTISHESAMKAAREALGPELPYESRKKNVGDMERAISLVIGGAMALNAMGKMREGRTLRGLLMMALGGGLVYRGTSGYSPLYHAFGVTSEDATFASTPLSRAVSVSESITIMKPAGELYGFWRDFRNLPSVMSHLERVDVIDSVRSHWVAQGPGGYSVEWDAEIVDDEPGEVISWRSVEHSEVYNRGTVTFRNASAGRGTEIMVHLSYRPPAGVVGAMVAKVLGRAPDQEIREDLRQFKHVMETGEAPTIKGQPHGTCP